MTSFWLLAGAAVADGTPSNTGLPSISGTPRQGPTLTELAGGWSGAQSVSLQRERCTDIAGLGCAPIPGATNPTWVLRLRDVGNYIRVVETAENPAGSSSAASLATALMTAAPSPPPTPTIYYTPQVALIITSTMQWTFYYTPRYTRVLALIVQGVSPGSTTLIGCHGRGCPFTHRVVAPAHTLRCRTRGEHKCRSPGTIVLRSAFRDRRLFVGTRFTVAIVRVGWVGKFYRFTIRSKSGPRVEIAPLKPGQTHPRGSH
jgi:hypothetical protein